MQHGTRFARRTHWRSHAVARDAMMRRTAAHCGSALRQRMWQRQRPKPNRTDVVAQQGI
jgi:hypothetical protein